MDSLLNIPTEVGVVPNSPNIIDQSQASADAAAIDSISLSSIIQRGLVRSGRLVRLSVELGDVPGALADVTRLLGEAEANIVEVNHQRRFTLLPFKTVDVVFVLQTRGLDHLSGVVKVLTDAGYKPKFSQIDSEILEESMTGRY